jgi:hypothetical protein
MVTEMAMPHTGTAKNLYVTASAAGKDGTSGLVTLYKNGSATALTCRLGTNTNCHDITHTATFNAANTPPDTFSVRVESSTVNVNDSTANLRVTFDYQ